MRCERLHDGSLVGFGGGGGERERDLAQTEIEQAIAAARLAVIVAFRRRETEDLDLAIVQTKAPVYGRDLRFQRALIGQEDTRRAALDDRRRDGRTVDVG